MIIVSAIKIAWQGLFANKVRTSLTVLGMVIGIASVIVVFSAGEGINSLILGEVESFGGSDMIETEIKVPSGKQGTAGEAQSGSNLAMGVQITSLTLEDMDDINKLANIKQSYAGIMGQEQASYGNESKKAFLFGTTASFIDMDKSEIDTGRFFTDAEDKSLAAVAVLGYKVKEKLFADSDPIGRFIKIRNQKYRVIGTFKERGAVMIINFDDFVYVPIRTVQKRTMGIDHVTYLMHEVKDQALLDDTAEEIRSVLRENHDIAPNLGESKDDFRVISMVESMELMETLTGAITLLLLAIVAISLIVGGVGIMNIMYVIVSERTGEIGLRKAVGAKYADIMWQFLLESILITIAGGIIGTILGVTVSYLISWGAQLYGFNWDFNVPLKAFLVALGFSLFFGIAFGLYPARRAAKLVPIEALYKE